MNKFPHATFPFGWAPLGASLFLSGVLFTGCGPAPQPEAPATLVLVLEVADGSTLTERSFPVRAQASQEVNLSFRVNGPLIELPVSVGDTVEAGDVVARIDPQDYIRALEIVNGQIQTAQASEIRAAADFKRIDNVFKEDPGATSESALDLARNAKDSSAATVRSLLGAVKTAEDKVNYTSLQAPFAGEVVETYVENFETVVAKQPILRLLDPSSIECVVSVPESLIRYAKYVEDITVTFDALPGVEVPATIEEIGREASQATRTYPVTLIMEQPEGAEILPGMAGSTRITSQLPDDVKESGMEIPATAVFSLEDADASYVWVVGEGNAIQRREVQTGQLTARGILIRSGLQAGDQVVTRGVHSVEEGQVVRVLTAPGEEGTP